MISKLGKFIPSVFLLSILFILGNFVLTFYNLKIVHDTITQSQRTSDTIRELNYTTIDLLSAESRQRGYLITGDKNFLNSYSNSIKQFDGHFKVLKEITADDPVQRKSISTLEQKVNKRLGHLKDALAIVDSQGIGAVSSFIMEGEGTREMEEVIALVNQTRNYELENLNKKQQDSQKSFETLYIGTTTGTFLSLLLVALSYYLIKRELQKRTELEKNKDEFINMVSHELKTPITTLKVYTEVVRKKLDEKNYEDSRRYISKIDEQTNKLSSLIIDLLDMSRIQTGKIKIDKEPLNLDALIDDTIEAIQGTTRKHELIIKGGIGRTVNADRYRIYQVLVNLLTNAIKYSPKGGRIIVESKADRKNAIVSIKDPGIGIDEKFQKKIFDRLYQVTDPKEKTFPGLGIGLFITYEIVKRHGGRIWVKSKKGRGSTFAFSLPFDEQI